MPLEYLEAISIHFPIVCADCVSRLAQLLATAVRADGEVTAAIPSREGFLPMITFDARSDQDFPTVSFGLSSSETISVYINNLTGIVRDNPSPYAPLDVEEMSHRLAKSGIEIMEIDHVGFNLPWFKPGVHPAIADLRNRLRTNCLYHEFPTGEPWDFIIPGDRAEISRRKTVDYSQTRKPKFELVSFDKASTPLIQIDVASNSQYEDNRLLFPEALNDPKMRNVWVYIRNPSDIDICLVLNGPSVAEWAPLFRGHRV